MTAQLLLGLDDVEQDRRLWDDVLEMTREDCAQIGTKRVERILERTDPKRFRDGDLARMLSEHERHELKAKHLVQIVRHAPTTRILRRLNDEMGLVTSEPPTMTPEQEIRALRQVLDECGELGVAVLKKAGLR